MSRNCCCGAAPQINCVDWCACLPLRARLTNLTLSLVRRFTCGNGLIARYTDTLQINNADLFRFGCEMRGDGSGTFSFSSTKVFFTDRHQGILNYPGCPNVNCGYSCDLIECRTETKTLSGTGPGVVISCDNPCQSDPITDAFSRLDYVLLGSGTYSDIGSNQYPDLDAYLACRFPNADPSAQNGPCSDFFDFTNTITEGRSGIVYGRRGCLTSSSFNDFNACNAIARLVDPDDPTPGFGNDFCSNTLGLPQCWACSNGTVVHNYQRNGVLYTLESCPTNGCCGCHNCADYQGTTNNPVEVYCCGDSNCASCQFYNGSCFKEQKEIAEVSASIDLVIL